MSSEETICPEEDDRANLSPRSEPEQPTNFGLKVIQVFFPSRTFLKFLVAAIIPAIGDQLVPLFYTGQIPDQSALAIVGQFTFISVILEVIQEGVVNSLFHFVGKNYRGNRALAHTDFKLCLLVLLGLGTVLTVALLSLTPQFVKHINTPGPIVAATEQFLWWSAFSFPLVLVNQALVNFFYITTSTLLIPAQILQVSREYMYFENTVV